MSFIYNYSLKSLNTFGIDVMARQFATFQDIESLKNLLSQIKPEQNLLVIGGGSNMLFTKDFDGVVIKNEIKGIELINEDNSHYFVKAGAGEIWHDLVMFCVANNYQGIENLALIPGCVGASPMQNIGAYGVELKDVFHELDAIEITTGNLVHFNLQECKFGYRESVFKNELKNKFIIVSVTFKLNKLPVFNTSYGNISSVLNEKGIRDITMKEIADAVIEIRSSKLPDPKIIGNAGSFFKNPEIGIEQFEKLRKDYPTIVGYPTELGKIKVAAGWLIENAGWKGKVFRGAYGVHKNQALVLVNYGAATGSEIFELSQNIIDSVFLKFDIKLNREVNIY